MKSPIRHSLLIACVCVCCGSAHAQTTIKHRVIAPGAQMGDGQTRVYSVVAQPVVATYVAAGTRANNGYIYVVKNYYLDSIVSVVITHFGAALTARGVDLDWEIGHADGLVGFHVYRAIGDGDFVRLTAQPLSATEAFAFRDEQVRPSRTYRYRLGAIDDDGEAYSPIVLVATPKWRTRVDQNYPNPFNPTTTIEFYLAEPTRTTLRIFDVTGALVRTLVDEPLSFGRHRAQWNGRNDDGQPVGSGVYFYRFRAGNQVFTKKMMLLK